MSDRPSRDEICVVLALMADRVESERGGKLDPIVALTLKRAIVELKLHIPGLFSAPDQGSASALATASAEAIRRGRIQTGLSRALRGLSFSPHDPNLWYLAGTACLQLGEIELAVRSLQHAVWIHPKHEPASRDLGALAAFDSISKELQVPSRDEPPSHLRGESDYADDPRDLDEDGREIYPEDEDRGDHL